MSAEDIVSTVIVLLFFVFLAGICIGQWRSKP